MLKEKLRNHINDALQNDATKIDLYKEEIVFSERNGLLPNGVEVSEKANELRFSNAYVERCEKETVALVLVEIPTFLKENIDFLKKHTKEFIYVESPSFELLGIDAISLELDDVFGTYTAMLGLKLQKKYEAAIKEYLDTHLTGDEGKYSVAFSGKDGLWDMNFALNYSKGFEDDITLLEAYNLTYAFIFSLVETIEETK